MPANTRRLAARVAVTVLLVGLAGGCGGDTTTSTATSPASTASTTAAPTTPTVLPMTAEELAWLTAITRLHKRIDKAFSSESVTLTRAKMVELGNALGACSRELRRIGSPSDRLQPVYTIVKKACRTFDKGAKCFATAARVSDASGAVIAGSAEERTQRRATDCGFAASGNGSNLLADAESKGAEIKLAAGS
jgi:hypothetical protein